MRKTGLQELAFKRGWRTRRNGSDMDSKLGLYLRRSQVTYQRERQVTSKGIYCCFCMFELARHDQPHSQHMFLPSITTDRARPSRATGSAQQWFRPYWPSPARYVDPQRRILIITTLRCPRRTTRPRRSVQFPNPKPLPGPNHRGKQCWMAVSGPPNANPAECRSW